MSLGQIGEAAAFGSDVPPTRAGRVLMPLRELWRFWRAPGAGLPAFASRLGAFGFYAHLFALLLVVQLAWVFASAGIKAQEGVAFRGFDGRGWALALSLIVIAPILEELIFRSWLKASIFLPALALWFGVKQLMPSLSLLTSVQCAAYAFLAIVLVVRRDRLRAGMAEADAALVRWRPATVRVSTTVFALLHAGNWDLPAGSLWLLPVLVVPQFASGVMLAYARLRSGLGTAIALHVAINACVVLVAGAGALSSK